MLIDSLIAGEKFNPPPVSYQKIISPIEYHAYRGIYK